MNGAACCAMYSSNRFAIPSFGMFIINNFLKRSRPGAPDGRSSFILTNASSGWCSVVMSHRCRAWYVACTHVDCVSDCGGCSGALMQSLNVCRKVPTCVDLGLSATRVHRPLPGAHHKAFFLLTTRPLVSQLTLEKALQVPDVELLVREANS